MTTQPVCIFSDPHTAQLLGHAIAARLHSPPPKAPLAIRLREFALAHIIGLGLTLYGCLVISGSVLSYLLTQ
jgi:hypothetical protein